MKLTAVDARVGMDRGVVVAHPRRVGLVVCGVRPYPGADGNEADIAVTERGLAPSDPMLRAAEPIRFW